MQLIPDAGIDLNAFYDGEGLNFFHYDHADGTVTRAGASADVVAHETGHALLDVLRPELWSVNTVEAAAFHEAFADCMALLTALEDQPTRQYLVSRLDGPNAVEALAEDLADGVRRAFGPGHPAAEPRHARNAFVWQLPSHLPASGPASALTREFHSFSRVFTGCLYDLIRHLFAASPERNEAALAEASRTAGRLLIAGAGTAMLSPRFFASVARAMVQADAALFAGAHLPALRAAFDAHGLAAPASMMAVEEIEPAGAPWRRREVDLGDLDPRLAGCVATATAPRAAGILPELMSHDDEVKTFVATLLAHDRIAFDDLRHREAVAPALRPPASPTTHEVRLRHGRKMLTRVRFV